MARTINVRASEVQEYDELITSDGGARNVNEGAVIHIERQEERVYLEIDRGPDSLGKPQTISFVYDATDDVRVLRRSGS